ncbi:MAG: ABC transporter ATP-binding protein [Mucilaginibacter sp.]|uniref:ABC transporter ATP-binding protein n=1 Tax=Mucilaginibacter sp. L3T2-6 TaxID=3062491 RepID=UPI002676DE99|nr:ABC transporter ATP-binding protein [Mucilaginibacter sp. L3T2-6]MDO3643894.1 ABC transporter ATP-binding protein [Mucilaginibacter sp. L3T2-6]MDV6216383.1 ABC transporter ATP-binding protein [Mucilaginibacter sp. L3T2-6]
MEITAEKAKEHTAKAKETAGPVISIKGLKKSFGSKEVLKNINLELEKGENIVILGRSGTGKSVTIQCIVGMLTPDAGSVKVFGQEVSELSEKELKELRIRVGFLFQSGALYDSMTVRENMEFPLTRVLKMNDQAEIDKKVEEALDSVGLLDAIDKMPSDLSGGMRKRAGLARTIIVDPEIILYDEPTTGLDPITSREISDLILKIQKKQKTSSIIITHDMECARIASDRVVIMNDGEYVAEGTFDELHQSKDEIVKSYFADIP